MSEPGKASQTIKAPVVAIGASMTGAGGKITGAGMMFQLLVDLLAERGWSVKVFNISEQRGPSNSRTIGGFSFLRMLDYVRLIPAIWIKLFSSRKGIVYLTTAQSTLGFMRDMLIIWPSFLRGSYLICHQFGGNYQRFYSTQSRFVRFLVRKTLSLPRKIVVEGQSVKEQFAFLDDYQDKVCCVANGVPERSLEVASKAKVYDAGTTFNMFYLSNMIETKGYRDVLTAVGILKRKKMDVFCRFVGKFMAESDSHSKWSPSQARRDFFAYIHDNELQENVSYEESLLGREKHNAFVQSHLFLLPSNYINEGQPVSVLEAMAHGLVSIVTNYSLIPVMVEENNTGLFVPYGDPEAIAEKVAYLMNNPLEYERLSGNSIRRFREHFTTECYINKMTTLFMQVTE